MMTMRDYMTPTCGAPQRQRAPTRNVEKLNVAQRVTPLVEVLNPHRRRRLWGRYPASVAWASSWTLPS